MNADILFIFILSLFRYYFTFFIVFIEPNNQW